MKILLVHNYYQQWSGEDTHFELLVKLLKEKGNSVITYTKDSKNVKTVWDKVKTALGMLWNGGVYDDITRLIEKHQPEVVQFQNIYPLISPTVYWACKKKGIPIVQRISNYRPLCPKGSLFRNNRICELCVNKRLPYPSIMYGCYHGSRLSSLFFTLAIFFHRFILKSYDLIDKTIFPSEFIQAYYLDRDIVSQKKAIVIPSFTIPGIIRDIGTIKRGYFLYAGQLIPEKGIDQLLKLFSKNLSLNLMVIGHDPSRLLANKYRKYDNIEFKGFMNKKKVLAYMKNAKATIMPSLWYDVLPNVLIESFSVGTPVIAPNIGVFPELIESGKTGMLFKYSKWSELGSIFMKFKKDKTMVEYILRRHDEKFGSNKFYSSLVSLYQSL